MLAFLITLLMGELETSKKADELLAVLASRIPVEIVEGRPTTFAGKYTSTPKELLPALAGEELYLFADGSYLYVEWADIMPPTIYDRGRWKTRDAILCLVSDDSVTWHTRNERQYLIFRRSDPPAEIRLAALQRDIPYFAEKAGDDPDFMLLLTSMVRDIGYTPMEGMAVKDQLLKEAWKPEWFVEK